MLYLGYCWLRERLSAEAFSHYLASLPAGSRDKVLRYRRWEDGHRSLYGQLLLLEGLRALPGPEVSLSEVRYTRFGRPYLDGAIDFNITHSGNLVVCAVSDAYRVGIDTEEIKPIEVADFAQQWTAQEWGRIQHDPGQWLEFYRFWTRKEAVVKAEGSGLSVALRTIDVTEDVVPVSGQLWYLTEVKLALNYPTHLATNQPLLEVIHAQEVSFGGA